MFEHCVFFYRIVAQEGISFAWFVSFAWGSVLSKPWLDEMGGLGGMI